MPLVKKKKKNTNVRNCHDALSSDEFRTFRKNFCTLKLYNVFKKIYLFITILYMHSLQFLSTF